MLNHAFTVKLLWYIGEGNGNPLQCSCLENPRDGGAWWAAVYGVAQSRTRLKRLSSSSTMIYKKWNISCRISKQGRSQLSAIATITVESWWALRELRKEGIPALYHSSHQTTVTSCGEPWGNAGCGNTGYRPQTAEVHTKGMISVSPDCCIFPYTEKVLNSLRYLPFLNSNLLKFWLLGLCCKNYIWLLPYLFGAVSQSCLRCCVPGWSPQFCSPNKTWSSTFRFFFSVDTLVCKFQECW